jgi:hypothetical protein
MDSLHELFWEVIASTGNRIAAIRAIRERIGLDLRSVKEVMLQVEGTASSLSEHETKLAEELEWAFDRDRQSR